MTVDCQRRTASRLRALGVLRELESQCRHQANVWSAVLGDFALDPTGGARRAASREERPPACAGCCPRRNLLDLECLSHEPSGYQVGSPRSGADKRPGRLTAIGPDFH